MEKPGTSKSPIKGLTATSQTGAEHKDLVAEITAAQETTFSRVQPEPEKETVTPPKEISFPNQNAPPFCPLGISKDNGTQEILERLETTFYPKPGELITPPTNPFFGFGIPPGFETHSQPSDSSTKIISEENDENMENVDSNQSGQLVTPTSPES